MKPNTKTAYQVIKEWMQARNIPVTGKSVEELLADIDRWANGEKPETRT